MSVAGKSVSSRTLHERARAEKLRAGPLVREVATVRVQPSMGLISVKVSDRYGEGETAAEKDRRALLAAAIDDFGVAERRLRKSRADDAARRLRAGAANRIASLIRQIEGDVPGPAPNFSLDDDAGEDDLYG